MSQGDHQRTMGFQLKCMDGLFYSYQQKKKYPDVTDPSQLIIVLEAAENLRTVANMLSSYFT